MLVGNKADLKLHREVTEERAKSYCAEHNLSLVETSAKDNVKVEDAFQQLITEIYKELIRKNTSETDYEGMDFTNLILFNFFHFMEIRSNLS